MTTILLILLGVISGFMYYSTTGEVAVEEVLLIPREDNTHQLESFLEMGFDFSILDSSEFLLLKSPSSDLDPGVTGRANMFAPF